MGGWLFLTTQASPAVFLQLTSIARAIIGKQLSQFSQFVLFPYYTTRFSSLEELISVSLAFRFENGIYKM